MFLLLVVVVPLQINLDLTEWASENDVVPQHDCLHVAASLEMENDPDQMISYCLSEWPTKWNIQPSSLDQNFTFAELSMRNITSQQLYLWSAPMDIIEHYQLYLDQLSNTNETFITTHLFYNCTLPRFGPKCQYSLDDYNPRHLSLNEIISDYYSYDNYNKGPPTCYTHLQCNLGSPSLCLDWSDICNNIIQCENGIDEEHCWQMEMNECRDNEYRCINGQCIHSIFRDDNPFTPDCLDRSDESRQHLGEFIELSSEPTFRIEDMLCWEDDMSGILRYTASCFSGDRIELRKESMFSHKSNSMADVCWSAVKCFLQVPDPYDPECNAMDLSERYKEIIQESCPDMFYMPPVPVMYGHIYLAYTKKYIVEQKTWTNEPEYICYNEQLCGGFHPNRTLVSFNNATCHHLKDFSLTFDPYFMQNLISSSSSACPANGQPE